MAKAPPTDRPIWAYQLSLLLQLAHNWLANQIQASLKPPPTNLKQQSHLLALAPFHWLAIH